MSAWSGSSPDRTFRAPPTGAVSFSVPDGVLTFGPDDLDTWAEHLTWCLGFLGVSPGSTIAIQDFGASPLSFLASALLTPGLDRGVAERLDGRVVCLDASPDRVSLSPPLLDDLGADVLIVRDEVAQLLVDLARDRGADLAGGGATRLVLAVADLLATHRPPGRWEELLLVERSMLLAPRCETCGRFHLRSGWYDVDGPQVRNERMPSASPHLLTQGVEVLAGGCPRASRDSRLDESTGGDR